MHYYSIFQQVFKFIPRDRFEKGAEPYSGDRFLMLFHHASVRNTLFYAKERIRLFFAKRMLYYSGCGRKTETESSLMDIKHFYIEKGTGKTIILLHGNGESSDYFKGQIDEFANQYHVYAIDTRGHGRTPRGEMPFTIRQFSDDLLGFMDEHQIGKAHLLGFSDGGNIAMVFAIQHPDRVDRLILNGANLNTNGVKRSTQVPIEIGYRIARKFSGKSDSARRNAEMLGLMVNDPNLSPGELAGIRAKTMVIAGTRDVIKEAHTRKIADCIPDARLVFVKGSHFIANRHPKEFNRAVLDFLQA